MKRGVAVSATLNPRLTDLAALQREVSQVRAPIDRVRLASGKRNIPLRISKTARRFIAASKVRPRKPLVVEAEEPVEVNLSDLLSAKHLDA